MWTLLFKGFYRGFQNQERCGRNPSASFGFGYSKGSFKLIYKEMTEAANCGGLLISVLFWLHHEIARATDYDHHGNEGDNCQHVHWLTP